MPIRKPNIEQRPVRLISPELAPGHATAGLVSLWQHRRLLWDFVLRDLQRRYTGSSIGFLWTIVTPLLELVTYTFVFHGLIGVDFHPAGAGGWTHYALFLFSGMVTWLAVSDGLSHATVSITNHGHLIKKVQFPSIVLPAHLIISATLNQGIRMLVLILGALFVANKISWLLLIVPFVMIIQAAFTLGLGLLLSTANIYFRDTNHWVSAFLLMWMFVTPIFYPAIKFPKQYILLLQLNPLSHLVGIYRELVLNQAMPHTNQLVIALVMASLSLLIGYSVFHHHQHRFADFV